MSVGGIFKLITNDGKQDRMLMATALLNRRLMDIERMRSRNPEIKDPTPTLVDIERTHVLFMNAHFKPFAAIGYEYNVVKSEGVVSTNSTVRFSLPQFGDFFNDMGLHVILPPITSAQFDFPSTNLTAAYANYKVGLKYYSYPGLRMIDRASFTVNGNPLDSYTSLSSNIFQKFYVRADQRAAWNTCVGQYNANPFYTTTAAANVGEFKYLATGPQIPTLTQIPPNMSGSGPRTATATVAPLELIIPLQFWFNLDPRLSIPSVAIPYGQRFIDLQMTSINNILVPVIIYNNTEIIVGKDNVPDFGGSNFITYNGIQVYKHPKNVLPEVNFTKCELYINNIFVNPEIHDIYIRRIGFSLIRVHLEQRLAAHNFDNVLLFEMKWPIETLYIGVQPDAQLSDPDFWCSFETVIPIEGDLAPTLSLNSLYQIDVGEEYNPDIQWFPQTVRFGYLYPPFKSASVEAHGISLYKDFPTIFYNGYLPFTYSGRNISTTTDRGILMINFNLYPGAYQPSGHINASRAREFYFKYVIDPFLAENGLDFDTNTPATLYIAGVAINFLLISDGSAILRYST